MWEGYVLDPTHKYYIPNINARNFSLTLVTTADQTGYESVAPGGKIITGYKSIYQIFIKVDSDETVNMLVRAELFDLTAVFGAGNEPSTSLCALLYTGYWPAN